MGVGRSPTGGTDVSVRVRFAIEEAAAATPELLAALRRLLPQLSRSAPPLTETALAEVVASPVTRLLLARTDSDVIGSLTLVVFRIPTGVRAWIEDVVVDESARGHGVGEALTAEALSRAREAGARTVELTSRPSRQAAHRLYRRLGFEIRDTNVYRFELR
jgi:ribosomal protein S18 acetylase RimI-like enzyme